MKLAAFAFLLLAACSVYATPPGTPRVRYTVGFSAGADEAALKQAIDVYKQRLGNIANDAVFDADAKACLVTVELPVSTAFRADELDVRLGRDLPADAKTIQLPGWPRADGPPLQKIDEEWMKREPEGFARGLFGSTPTAHKSGARVQYFRDDLVRTKLRSRGEFEFLEQMTDDFLAARDTTLEAERARFDAWRNDHPAFLLVAFDTLPRAQGGPVPGTLWRRLRSTGDYVRLKRSAEPRFRFSGRDVASTSPSQDQMGQPALEFELAKERGTDFGDWTQSLIGHGLAIVLDDEVLTLAAVRSRLPGGGLIEGGAGGFTKEELGVLREVLNPTRTPHLPVQPLALTAQFLP